MSFFLVRSTLRAGWRVGLAIAGGIAIVDALYAACTLATGTSVARRAIGERATRIADSVAGLGMLSFGGVLASTAVHDR
jgi:threonine/homoserine/homoserine lactone efflux protein